MFRQGFSLRHTIFTRLFATFLLIMTPIFLLGFYIYNWSVRTASEDIMATAESQITVYLADFENEIERMKLLLYGTLSDEYLNKLAITWETMGNIQRTESINLAWDRMFTIKNSSAYIKDVSVHIPATGKSISAENGAYGFDAERYRSIRTIFGQGARMIVWQDRLHLSASKPSGSRDAEPLFVVEVELDTAKLRDVLGQFNTHPGSGSFLLVEDASFLVRSGAEIDEAGDLHRLAESLKEEGGQTVAIGESDYYFIRASSGSLGVDLYKYIPADAILEPIDKFYLWAWLFVLAAVGIIVVYALSTYKFIHKPLLTLVKSFRRMENGDLNIAIEHAHNDEFRYLYSRFNYMVANLRHLIDQVYKQRIMTQRAELKQLQSQINPHFLYNSFFILNTMARTGDTESVEQFTNQLGEYYQFIARNASDEISLDQEIHHARIYTNIQALRFSRRIMVRFDPLPEELRPIAVPRLIVQPIIENAFEHSLEKMARGGAIVIRFELEPEEARIVVEDNGAGLGEDELRRLADTLRRTGEGTETTGMINIHRRLVLHYGTRGGLVVARSGLGGLQVAIRLPNERGAAHVPTADRR